MRDAFERIRDWLAEDFEKKGLDSALVEYQREHWDSFRIKLKRLYRLAMRDGARAEAQRELVMYLLDTLLDDMYRLNGRAGRIDSMVGNPCLDVLVDLGMQRLSSTASTGETGVRTALLAARRYVRDASRWPGQSWWEAHRNEVAALADAMLKADHVNYKSTSKSGYEIALEWFEDVLRGDVLLGEMNRARALACMRSTDDPSKPSTDLVGCFKQLKKKAEKLTAVQSFLDAVSAGDERAARDALDPLLMDEAKTTLKDMGVVWSDDPNAEGYKRKKAIPYELAVAYFDEKGGWGIDNDDLWRDLQDFYEISFEDDAYRHVFVPFVQDEGTGVGVYLVGSDELGSFIPGARCGRAVTIALIDPRLADHEPVVEDRLEQIRRNRDYNQHPLKIVPKVKSYDSLINQRGGRGLSPDWMDLCKDHIKEQYEYWVYLALSKSIWKKQGFDEVPDDCPDRFRRYFEGQVEPPELFA